MKKYASLVFMAAFVFGVSAQAGDHDSKTFGLIRSAGLQGGVLQNASGQVSVRTLGPIEQMSVTLYGLPPNTDFDLFIIQVPNKPFGVAWYQGDIMTDEHGVGNGVFLGRFSVETFAVSLAAVPAPRVFFNAFPDSNEGAKFGRTHTYHIGVWFNSPIDGGKAGAPGTTPFNGEGNAGVQVLNSGGFPNGAGPLEQVFN